MENEKMEVNVEVNKLKIIIFFHFEKFFLS